MPGAPSSVLAPSSDVAHPGAHLAMSSRRVLSSSKERVAPPPPTHWVRPRPLCFAVFFARDVQTHRVLQCFVRLDEAGVDPGHVKKLWLLHGFGLGEGVRSEKKRI